MNLQGNIAVHNASKAHKLKVKVKKICQQMDELKTSKVKVDVFFSVLRITNIRLSKDVENELVEKYSSQGLIDYKEALSRIAINLEEDKPLNTNWVLRSAQSSMRSSAYSSHHSNLRSSQSPNLISKSRVEGDNMKINNELGQISANNLNLSNDLNSKVPFPRDILKSMKSKTPINGKLLSQKGRVTPGQNNPVKLINQHIKSMHETGFNIITNKDWKESDKGIEENDRMISQTMSDYQDFTKYIKKNSVSSIALNWKYYDNDRKLKEIGELIKEVSSDELKCAKLIDELGTIKALLNEKEQKSEIEAVNMLIKNLELPKDSNLLKTRKSDQEYIDKITKELVRLFDTNKFPFDSTLLDQIIQKLKPDSIKPDEAWDSTSVLNNKINSKMSTFQNDKTLK